MLHVLLRSSLLCSLLGVLATSPLARASEVVVTFNAVANDARTGWIDHYDSGWPHGERWTGHLGSVQWGGSFYLPTHDYRGNVFFDTWGQIPCGAKVTKVEFLYAHKLSYTSGPPISFACNFWVSSRGWGIGNNQQSINAYDLAEGTSGPLEIWPNGLETKWIDLGTNVLGEVDCDIYGTVVQMRDQSGSAGPATWAALLDVPRCRLRVTYDS